VGFGVNRQPKTGSAVGTGKARWDDVYPQTKELKKARKNRVDQKIEA
jgi:hypothetical protein